MWNRGEDTYCAKCPKPRVFDENKEAIRLFHASSTQFEQGFSGATRMIYSEVKLVAQMIGINFKKCFPALLVMEAEYLKIVRDCQKKEK